MRTPWGQIWYVLELRLPAALHVLLNWVRTRRPPSYSRRNHVPCSKEGICAVLDFADSIGGDQMQTIDLN